MIDNILIAGGGIGGLSAALAIANTGRAVDVLERAPELTEIGAGIQLGPNAFHAFDKLGIGEHVRQIAVFVDRLRLMDAISGEEITHIALEGAFRRRFGNPYAVVHRGQLHKVLLDACKSHSGVSLNTDSIVTGYEQDADSIAAVLANGTRRVGALLVGADGLWSVIRAQLVGDGAPRVSGHTTYRSVIPTEQMPEDLRWNAATLWAGPKCHIVHYPLSDWKAFNLVVTYHNDAASPVAGEEVEECEVLRGFEHVHERARDIIKRGTAWRRWVLCDRDPVEKWTDGRAVLLGDAAHPMLQYFAQGACMAVEDGVVLAQALAENDGHEAALATYVDARLLRTAQIQLQSRVIGDHIYHPVGAHAALRNMIMGAKSSETYYGHLEWLYGHRV